MPINTTPINENADIQELLKILKEQKMTEHFKTLTDTVNQISTLENQLDTVKKQLENVNQKLEELTKKKHPVSDAFRKMVQNLEEKVNKLQSQLNDLKQSLIGEVRKTIDAFKQKGISALNNIVKILKIKENLNSVANALFKAEQGLDKAIEKLDNLDDKAKKPSLLGKVDENKATIKKAAPVVKKVKSKEAAI